MGKEVKVWKGKSMSNETTGSENIRGGECKADTHTQHYDCITVIDRTAHRSTN